MAQAPPYDPPAPRRSWLGLLWPVGLSLTGLLLVGYFTYEPGALGQMWEALNPWLLAAALGTVVVRVCAGGWRIRYASHGQVPLATGIRGQLIWDFAANITPSAIGGGPIVAFAISSEDDSEITLGDATAVMLFTMLADQIGFSLIIPLLLLASFYTDVFPEIGSFGAAALVGYFVFMMVWTGVFAYATLLKPALLQYVLDKVFRIKWLRRYSSRVQAEAEQMAARSAQLRTQPASFFAVNIAVGLVTWLCRYALLFFLAWAVVPALPKLQFFARTVAMMKAALIIPTPGASGGMEGLFALFLAPLLPKAMLAPLLLSWRFLAYYLFLIIGGAVSTDQVRRTLQRRDDPPPTTARPEQIHAVPHPEDASQP